MEIGYPPTALETTTCPPHRYYLDGSNMGICLKCGLVKDFDQAKQVTRVPPKLSKKPRHIGKNSKARRHYIGKE